MTTTMEQKRDDLLRQYRARQKAQQDKAAAARIADVEFLADLGVNEVEAARRVGMRTKSLYALLARRKRTDLWVRLTAYRAPRVLNDWERASNRG